MKRIVSILAAVILLFSICGASGAQNNSTMDIFFLDVGEGDSTFVLCDGYCMLVDGGPSDYSDYIFSLIFF